MAFDNVTFPIAIARSSTGGPERRTDVVTTASGHEERNSRWAHSRRRYNIGSGMKSLADIQAVVAFFEARRGRLHGFRFRDHTDHKSCAPSASPSRNDQVLGLGDGVRMQFQLVKTYGTAPREYVRTILAPVASTVVVAVNGVEATAFSVNVTTGVVTFNAGNVPPLNATVTAGFLFDVPVRFDTDAISINLSHFEAGEIPDIPLLEVR
jgi:uncharacterized protein (TIGR02217 family)